ncbi:MAG: hypothetical protein Q9208_007186 [Pyrenodesmia sp. 3 TL-2023]
MTPVITFAIDPIRLSYKVLKDYIRESLKGISLKAQPCPSAFQTGTLMSNSGPDTPDPQPKYDCLLPNQQRRAMSVTPHPVWADTQIRALEPLRTVHVQPHVKDTTFNDRVALLRRNRGGS